MQNKQIQNCNTSTINILSAIHHSLDCSIWDSESKQICHYGMSEDIQQAIFDAVEKELSRIGVHN